MKRAVPNGKARCGDLSESQPSVCLRVSPQVEGTGDNGRKRSSRPCQRRGEEKQTMRINPGGQ